MPLGTTAPPATGQPLRHRLGNGLTVVLLPDPEVPAVAVAVGYDTGYRSEARPGFAHLFEHLMFQGSSSLPKLGHAERVQAAGGAFNAVTQRDHTCYYQVVPAEALELVLFLEADRMRGPRITPETIANQIAVVTEEINQNFLGRPYGGFPAFTLPPVLFRDEANTHNGYGDTRSLSGVTPQECERFFADHYTPGSAVLAISGAFDPRHALDLADKHFGALPARPRPPRRDHTEPPPDQERAHTVTDPLAPAAAVAVGWRCPAPGTPAHLAALLVAALLGDPQQGRLRRTLVRAGQATQAAVLPSLTGQAFDARDPEALVATAVCAPGRTPGEVAALIRHQLALLAEPDGFDQAELGRAVRRLSATWYSETDPVAARARRAAAFEVLYGRAELVTELPRLLADVDLAQVRTAAAALAACPPAVLTVEPAGGRP
ncbi:M16 family metallopeptidase [Kitasatospora sp. NPDC056651]|uniref:M16 family metallopeptidase n=1 Tax=Kitasatospora sp. NPDC056651 TaxID=3345892 RepID=UPI0036C52063